jgi:predicted 3-demethylubiquinone-9 3-methyltransferase (glyoxalase superfamily)
LKKKPNTDRKYEETAQRKNWLRMFIRYESFPNGGSLNNCIMAAMQKITSNLWFDNQAEEAANYYTGIFKNSRILNTVHYSKEGFDIHKMPEGTVMTVEFVIEGQKFIALNGGPVFTFNEAISFVINCANQQEIDYYWERLTAGGDPKAQQCGWLKDKFGVSWQVVPAQLQNMMQDRDREKSDRVMKVLLQMKKLDIHTLEEAYEGHVLA